MENFVQPFNAGKALRIFFYRKKNDFVQKTIRSAKFQIKALAAQDIARRLCKTGKGILQSAQSAGLRVKNAKRDVRRNGMFDRKIVSANLRKARLDGLDALGSGVVKTKRNCVSGMLWRQNVLHKQMIAPQKIVCKTKRRQSVTRPKRRGYKSAATLSKIASSAGSHLTERKLSAPSQAALCASSKSKPPETRAHSKHCMLR